PATRGAARHRQPRARGRRSLPAGPGARSLAATGGGSAQKGNSMSDTPATILSGRGLTDLTAWLDPETPHVPAQPGFEVHRLRETPKDRTTLSVFTMTTHTGTHIDAPFHVSPSGKKIEDYPAEFFLGPA